MSKHTPEPWNANNIKSDPNDKACAIWTKKHSDPSEDRFICTGSADRPFDCDAETVHANMLRIVACVNGCEGIENPAAVRDLLAALKSAEATIRWAVQESNGRVKKEIVGGWTYHADIARDAIAAAEGRKVAR